MQIAPIINQLAAYLPLYSSNFSERLQALSLVVDTNNIVTVTTVTDHGLTTGDGVVVQGEEVSLKINASACVIEGNTVRFITYDKHNFVMDFNYKSANNKAGDNSTSKKAIITLADFNDPFYDGDHIISAIPNKNTVIVEFATTPPPIQADIPLCYDGAWYQIEGFHNAQVVNNNEFSFEIPHFPTEVVVKGNITVDKSMRVTGCVNNTRMVALYTAQPPDNLWAFVTNSNDVMSKDRQTPTDAVASRGYGVDYRMQLIDEIFVCLVAPSTDEIGGRLGHDSLETEKVNVIKALAGMYYQNQFSSGDQFKINYIGSDLYRYDSSVLIKAMQFQTSCDIVMKDVQRREFWRSAKEINSVYNTDYVANYRLNEDNT